MSFECKCARLLVMLAGLLAASTAYTGELTPFYLSSRNIFTQAFTIPAMEAARLAAPGTLSAAIVFDLTNESSGDRSPNEQIVLDGESHRVNLALRYGVHERLELGVDVPYIRHTGGVFDRLIEGFHDAFDLPNQARDNMSNDRLLIQYAADGVEQFRLGRSTSGLGDVQLSVATPVLARRLSDFRSANLRATLKLPTGDAPTLRGSESTDVSLSITLSDERLFGKRALGGGFRTGVLLLGDGEVLSDRQRDTVWFASVIAGGELGTRLRLKGQIDWHGSLYRSQLDKLGTDYLQLSVGATWRLPGFTIDFAISEDLVGDVAPDVTFHGALRRRF